MSFDAQAEPPFRLVFKPRVRLETGAVVGFEALLRGEHPPHGTLAASRSVLERGVAQLHAWEAAGHRGLQMAINTRPDAFDAPDAEKLLLELLARHGIAGHQIELEFTELSLAGAGSAALDRLRSLRRHGVSIAIDDFGTASTNLGRLARLPLDCLKLDLDLGAARGALFNPPDAIVARMCCELARALKLRVVVEGIETEGQHEFFSRLRCDTAQGRFYADPLDAEAATALLQSGRRFSQAVATPPQLQRTRHLLLLDDEPNILRSLRRVFRAQPWTVHIANTPDEAFELLARHPVGVVMSDQRMPLMRGTDFLARVKQLHPQTVRIVLSGYTELQSVTEAINEGAIYKFLTKPWNDLHLNEEIEQAFRQHETVTEGQLLQQRLSDTNSQLQSRLQREEATLDITHEAFGAVPVPILGIDLDGMIVISNAAADALFGGGRPVVGAHVAEVLPTEAAVRGAPVQPVEIAGVRYAVRRNAMGAGSRGTGTVITLLQESGK